MSENPFKKYIVAEGVKCVCNDCNMWFIMPENSAVCCPRCTQNNISTIWCRPVTFFIPEKILCDMEERVTEEIDK
jgi:hypothetical protein